MTDQLTHYAERDPSDLEPYFSQHVRAMTAEGLHSKAAIALELAYRDRKIAELEENLRIATAFNKSGAELLRNDSVEKANLLLELSRLRPVVEAARKQAAALQTLCDKLKRQGLVSDPEIKLTDENRAVLGAVRKLDGGG